MFAKFELPKLSDNEKKLLVFAGIIVAIGFYALVIFMPHYDSIMNIKSQYDTLIKKENTFKDTLNKVEAVQEEFAALVEKTKKNYSSFYPYILQEKFLDELTDIATKAGVDKPNYTFLTESCESLSGSTNKPQAKASDDKNGDSSFDVAHKKLQIKNPTKAKPNISTPAATDADLTFDTMGVTVEFKSSYEAAFAYISELSKRPRRPVIYDANISVDKDGTFKTTLLMKFFAVPFVESDNSFDQWSYNNPFGKQNPFVAGGITLAPPTVENKLTNTQKISSEIITSMPVDNVKYDLFVSAKPTISDVPTIVVGKGGDSAATSYIYADSESVEDVTITISGADGNYVASYNTSKDGKTDVPISSNSSNFSLCLISTTRVNSTDVSGINLTVNNRTNKKLIIKKKDEDANRPRIKLSTVGDVVVK